MSAPVPCDDPVLLAHAARNAPRYTSYPTAPHFSAAVDAPHLTRWLGGLSDEASLSLYLHIPYCRSLCAYCGCHTFAVRREAPLDAYTDSLIAEITLMGRMSASRRVVHIHWGGGTPSVLGAERLLKVYAALRQSFDLTQLRDHDIELDPRLIDDALIAALVQMGISRVSLGVQDLNAHVQEVIGRVQPFEVVADSVARLRAAGIDAINMDLIYGLPLQSVDDALHTVQRVLTLHPSRLAVFGYAHVPWFKSRQKLIADPHLPGTAERLQQAAAIRQAILAAGYQSIGLDHFAHPEDSMALAARAGTLRRNFQGYTTDRADALLGMGASAISQLPQGYAQNTTDLRRYQAAVADGQLATARGHALTADDRVWGALITDIMCGLAIDLRQTGPARQRIETALQPFVHDGLCQITEDQLHVTARGQPFTRLIAACFDAYQATSTARHAVAV